jgi:preprotein translocase subunit SecF
VIGALKAQDETVTLKRVEFVGPQVGEELTHDGLMALGMLVIGIMIYLAFRFEWKYAVSAILRTCMTSSSFSVSSRSSNGNSR